MHELAVTENLVKIAVETAVRNQAEKVTEIRIVMGEMSTYLPECIQEYFALLAEDTPAQGAKLVFTSVPAVLKCRNCGAKFHMEHMRFQCPECESMAADFVTGREFYVDSMDIETGEDQ